MPHEWETRANEVTAGAICRTLECGALVIAFRATSVVRLNNIQPWEFACLRCGIEFVVPEDELVFQSVPKDWLLAHVHLAYALQGDTAKARVAYKDFLTLWKDADPDIPVLKLAKAEYAKLQ
jgi:hypothetical protein